MLTIAQNKIDPALILERAFPSSEKTITECKPEISVLVTLTPGADIDELKWAGFDVSFKIGDVAALNLGRGELDKLASLETVKAIEPDRLRTPMLKYARDGAKVDELHAGINTSEGLTQFSGKGVVLGIVDNGFDPNHPNFRNPDGTSRVARFWNFTGSSDICDEYTPSTLYSFTADTYKSSHATHVAGIMGGRFYGKATFMQWDERGENAVLHRNEELPYYGVATEGTYALAGGIFSDRNILSGIQRIIDFAEQENMPAVINISLGRTTGPHDGSDAMIKSY